MVYLGNEAAEGSWGHVNLVAIIGTPSSVDVETGQNLANGLVDAEDNLEEKRY